MTLDEVDEWPVVQIHTTATPGQQITSGLLCSVFDLAHTTLKLRGKAQATERRKHYRVDHLQGLTRCTCIQEQETAEWKAREVARRARQIVPRAPKSAKTMSKRFAALVGLSGRDRQGLVKGATDDTKGAT